MIEVNLTQFEYNLLKQVLNDPKVASIYEGIGLLQHAVEHASKPVLETSENKQRVKDS